MTTVPIPTSTPVPLVTILCPAYNQEATIAEALDGIVMQRTSFPFEVIVHDDASTDGTAAVIRSYIARYPGIIRAIIQTENQYSRGGRIISTHLLNECRGTYVAVCDGDDAWTDPDKLSVQIAYLESHPEASLCHTRARMFVQHLNTFAPDTIGHECGTFERLLYDPGIVNLTAVYRRSAVARYLKEIVPEGRHWKMGDYPLWLFIAKHEKIAFIDTVTGTYRYHPDSMSRSGDGSRTITFLQSQLEVKEFFAARYPVPEKIRERYMLRFYYDILPHIFASTDDTVTQSAVQFLRGHGHRSLSVLYHTVSVFRHYPFMLRTVRFIHRRFRESILGRSERAAEGRR